ncbi:MAG: flavodoxin [Treponema sp.]|nr:flavodoxin [Treponema sp.]
MKKAVVYASTTGNTEQMANAVAEGVKASGAEVLLTTADAANAADVLAADVILLGSPAMGAEVLEDSMESFFSGIEGQISGKKIALFGSYDWGDCQFLRDWAERVKSAGATMLNGEGLSAHLTPEAADLEACKELGKTAQ